MLDKLTFGNVSKLAEALDLENSPVVDSMQRHWNAPGVRAGHAAVVKGGNVRDDQISFRVVCWWSQSRVNDLVAEVQANFVATRIAPAVIRGESEVAVDGDRSALNPRLGRELVDGDDLRLLSHRGGG